MDNKAVKRLFSGDDMDALSSNEPIMIQGADGVLYQVAGKNEEGQTLLVAQGGHAQEGEGEEEGEAGGQCIYVAQQDGDEVLTIDSAQLAHLMPEHVNNTFKLKICTCTYSTPEALGSFSGMF